MRSERENKASPRVNSVMAALEIAVSCGIERLEAKSNFWGQLFPVNTGALYQKGRGAITEDNIPGLLHQIGQEEFEKLTPDQKALATAAQEFVWEETPPNYIVEHQKILLKRTLSGEYLSPIEQTAVTLRALDTDSF